MSQRPTENRFDTIQQYAEAIEGSKLLDNPNLKPEKRTNYELGFRQRLGARTALQISGFFSQLQNQISRRVVANVFPNNYQTYENVDFGTVKGRRAGAGHPAHAQPLGQRQLHALLCAGHRLRPGDDQPDRLAPGAGSVLPSLYQPRLPLTSGTSSTSRWTTGWAKKRGRRWAGSIRWPNFGVNVIGNFGSGLPYTAQLGPHPIWDSFIQGPEGEINGQLMPASTLVNLRIDRRFSLGSWRGVHGVPVDTEPVQHG